MKDKSGISSKPLTVTKATSGKGQSMSTACNFHIEEQTLVSNLAGKLRVKKFEN